MMWWVWTVKKVDASLNTGGKGNSPSGTTSSHMHLAADDWSWSPIGGLKSRTGLQTGHSNLSALHNNFRPSANLNLSSMKILSGVAWSSVKLRILTEPRYAYLLRIKNNFVCGHVSGHKMGFTPKQAQGWLLVCPCGLEHRKSPIGPTTEQAHLITIL